jgi:hypothetical protein
MTCIQCDEAPAEQLSQFCAGCAREHRMQGEYDRQLGDMEYATDFSPLMRHAATHEERREQAAEAYRKRLREDRADAARWRRQREDRASPPA